MNSRKTILKFPLIGLVAILSTILMAGEQNKQGRNQGLSERYEAARKSVHWCGTELGWEIAQKAMGTYKASNCPYEGACDNPVNRDNANTDPKTIEVIVHVIRNNSGGGGVSQSTVDATIDQMNNDFSSNGTGIQFDLVATRYHNNSQYACIDAYSQSSSSWYYQILDLRAAFAETPGDALNIFISCQDQGSEGTLLGMATFPWETNAAAAGGGLWLNTVATGTGNKTASHEIGHCLGLWHTFHGVSEDTCSGCPENVNGFEGDIRGDLCSDTPATPRNFNCSQPSSQSDCNGAAFTNTQIENIMGYSGDACQDFFSTQQSRRMHCWTEDKLSGWLKDEPLNVTPLSNGVALSGLSGSQGSTRMFSYTSGSSDAIAITLSGGSGDADLYVSYGSQPSVSNAQYKSENGSNNESINIAGAQAGTYYILVYGYNAFSGATIKVEQSSGPDCLNGSLTGSKDSDVQPNGSYYQSTTSGTHQATLSGPSNADFDLYLQKWSGSAWSSVKSSTSGTSNESITYSGTSGYYRWVVYSYSGSGSYSLCESHP